MGKGLKKIKEFVCDELEDVGYFDYKSIKHTESIDCEHYYTITIKTIDNKEKELDFKYDSNDNNIFIDMNDDGNYEEIESFSYKIKYFWWKLLKWEV